MLENCEYGSLLGVGSTKDTGERGIGHQFRTVEIDSRLAVKVDRGGYKTGMITYSGL